MTGFIRQTCYEDMRGQAIALQLPASTSRVLFRMLFEKSFRKRSLAPSRQSVYPCANIVTAWVTISFLARTLFRGDSMEHLQHYRVGFTDDLQLKYLLLQDKL
jgi:hypothetical protein